MQRGNLDDLLAFLAVARERSFTKAAAKLGVSQSALSHTIRELEARLGVRLLTRTTRSVAPTEAGERLLQTVGAAPRGDRGRARRARASCARSRPAPSASPPPNMSPTRSSGRGWRSCCATIPTSRSRSSIDYGLTDIVAQRFDAGVRSGEQVAKDMIAVRIGPDMRMAVVGAPSYFASRPEPKKPQDLIAHTCINLRLPTHGGLYAWEFEKGGRELRVRVDGQIVFNGTTRCSTPRSPGSASPTCPRSWREPHIAKGRLSRVLEDWCPPFPGYHLYYPSRRQSSAAFALLVDALRYRG